MVLNHGLYLSSCVYTPGITGMDIRNQHESSALIHSLSNVYHQRLASCDLSPHALVHVVLLMFNFVLQSSACMSHLLWYSWWSGAHSSHPYGQWVGLQCFELLDQILVDVSVLWIFFCLNCTEGCTGIFFQCSLSLSRLHLQLSEPQ